MQVQKTFKNNKPTIFMVGTPIGNMDDMSFRAIETLKNVNVIYCEDTRTSAILLSKYNIKNKLVSLHMHNEYQRSEELLNNIKQGLNVAIISDAGVPGVSDPGTKVLNLLLKSEIEFNITSVNAGPAYIHALIASGFDCYEHYFVGFLEKKQNAQENQLLDLFEKFKDRDVVLAIYESVHRIKKTIRQIKEIVDAKTKIVIAREVTKLNEEFIRGTISEIESFLESNEFIEKGEFCILIDKDIKLKNTEVFTIEDAVSKVELLKKNGIKTKQAVNEVSKKYNINKNELYERFHK